MLYGVIISYKIVIALSFTIFAFLTYRRMEVSQVADKKKRRNRKKKVEIASDSAVEPSTNVKTVIDRKSINANWEVFLQNRPEIHKTNKESHTDTKNNNSLWKARRLEKKHNLKTNDIDKTKSNHINKDEQMNVATNPKENNILNPKTNDRIHSTNGIAAGGSNIPGGRVCTVTRCVAIDCEMVGIGPYGRDSILARVSLVNKFGDCIYDKFVKPREKVTDYRTPVSGVRKEDLMKGETFDVVQRDVAEIIRGRILVGHAIKKDLEVLYLSHPKRFIRDTSRYKPFRKLAMGGTPSLKNLSRELLGLKIQTGEHSSVEDARATMHLYTAHQRQWESAVRRKKGGTTS